MSVWDSEITTKFLTLEREQINYSAQNPEEVNFSMTTEVWKKPMFQYFLIGSWDSVWERGEMAEKPDCCQAPAQNVTEDISVHLNMLLQLCLQKTSLSQEVLKEQHGAGECPTSDLHLWKCTDFYDLSC